MKTMTEEELRAIDPKELENEDIKWSNGNNFSFIGRVLFDYDIGLSILDKERPDICLTGIHGPKYDRGPSNFRGKEDYCKKLTSRINLIKTGVFDVKTLNTSYQRGPSPQCSFT